MASKHEALQCLMKLVSELMLCKFLMSISKFSKRRSYPLKKEFLHNIKPDLNGRHISWTFTGWCFSIDWGQWDAILLAMINCLFYQQDFDMFSEEFCWFREYFSLHSNTGRHAWHLFKICIPYL